MIEPEKWEEYEERYRKYGFDMKPQPTQPTREKRAKSRQGTRTISIAGRKAALSAVLIIGFALIMMIITTAYCANLRYNINNMISENQALAGEIENLQVEVYSANNIEYIESKATSKLGMVYSTDKTRTYITDDIPEEGFADLLKAKAYD